MTTYIKYCIFPNTQYTYMIIKSNETCNICILLLSPVMDCLLCCNCCGCCTGYNFNILNYRSCEANIEDNVCGHYWKLFFPNSFSHASKINFYDMCCWCTFDSWKRCLDTAIECCVCSDCTIKN